MKYNHLVFMTFRFYIILMLLAFLNSCSENSVTQVINQTDSLAWNKKIAVAVVHSHASMLANMLKDINLEQDRIDFVRKSIDSVRFYSNKTGYFYVYNYDCLNIAHATQKDLQGKDLYNYTDTKGKFVIRELSSMAKSGGGFVEFYWIKPGDTGEKRKLGYVEPIKGTDWFIGTGVYME